MFLLTSPAEMIFELEEEGSERDTSEGPLVLSFVDSTPSPQRHGRHRSGSHTGLPASLSSLWPTSLPAHSARRQRTGIANTRANGGSHRSASPISRSEMDHDEDVDQQEEEILKLVAAHTPSHRGAWKRNSKAWKTLMNRHYIRDAHGVLVAEENEDDSERTPNDIDDSDWDVTQGTYLTVQLACST